MQFIFKKICMQMKRLEVFHSSDFVHSLAICSTGQTKFVFMLQLQVHLTATRVIRGDTRLLGTALDGTDLFDTYVYDTIPTRTVR